MKISAILLAGALVLASAGSVLAQGCDQGCGGPGPRPQYCSQYCWMEYITPINANINFGIIDSTVKSTALSGDNYVRVEGEIDDIHSSSAKLFNGFAMVSSGDAKSIVGSSITANLIAPMACSECSPKDGIYLNANIGFVDSRVFGMANSGDNAAKLSSEIEDLCHSSATLYGGKATVLSGDAWSETGSMIQVNLIGDWTADAGE